MQGIEPPYTDPYVRWCERSTSQLMASLLLDFVIKHYYYYLHVHYLKYRAIVIR